MDFSTDLNIYFPEAYATAPADWGSTFQSIIDAMPSTGGTIWLRPTTYTVDTQVNVNKPVRFMGHGMGDQYGESGGTRLVTTSTTLKMFNVTGGGVSFEQLVIRNAAATDPTAGAGIHVAQGANQPMYGNNDEYKSGLYLRKVAVIGFYDNVYFESGYLFGMDACHSRDMVRAGVVVQNIALADAGDSWIDHCHFFPRIHPGSQEIGILQLSSGGLRVSSTKFNSLFRAYEGQTAGTSILKFDNCSIENFTDIGIDANGELIQITNCQFAVYSGTPTAHIRVQNSTGIHITGNILRGRGTAAASTGMIVTGNTSGTVKSNTNDGITGTFLSASSNTGVLTD